MTPVRGGGDAVHLGARVTLGGPLACRPLSAVAQEPTVKPAPGKVRKQGLEATRALDVYLVSTYCVLRPNNRTLQLQPTRQGPGLHGAYLRVHRAPSLSPPHCPPCEPPDKPGGP